MRPPDRAAGCGRHHVLIGQRHADRVEARDDRLRALGAPLAVELELGLQRLDVAHMQAQQMHFLVTVVHAELHAGHEAQANDGGGALRLGHAGERVVVGQRKRREAGAMRGLDGGGGTQRSIGCGGMRMEVHAGRDGRAARLSGHDA